MRYPFWSVFVAGEEGRLCTRLAVNLNGVTLHAGDRICPAVSFGGFEPYRVQGRDLEGYRRYGELVIKAVYDDPRGAGALPGTLRRTQPLAGLRSGTGSTDRIPQHRRNDHQRFRDRIKR